MDWAWSASTTFDAVSSITEATSSLLGCGFEIIFISRERLRALAMEGAAILGVNVTNAIETTDPQRETISIFAGRTHFPCLGSGLPKNPDRQWPNPKGILFCRV